MRLTPTWPLTVSCPAAIDRVQCRRERLEGRGATQRRPTFRPLVVRAKLSLTVAALLSRNEIVVPVGARLAEIRGSRDPRRQRDGLTPSDEIVAGVSRETEMLTVATLESDVPSFALNVNWSVPEKFVAGV